MSKRTKSIIRTYGLTILLASCVTIYYIRSNSFSLLSTIQKYRVLCDAFTIPAVFLICFAVALMISNAGFFDGVFYGIKTGLKMLIPGLGLTNESYADYKARKRNKPIKGFWFILHVGLLFLAIAIVFLVLFNRLDV